MGSAVDNLTRWIAPVAPSRGQAIVLVVGLAVLAITLLVLMLTRWGQVKPLSKCVGLSVFAHVLLIVYAHCFRMLDEAPSLQGDDSVTVTLVAPSDELEIQPDVPEPRRPPAEDVPIVPAEPTEPDLAAASEPPQPEEPAEPQPEAAQPLPTPPPQLEPPPATELPIAENRPPEGLPPAEAAPQTPDRQPPQDQPWESPGVAAALSDVPPAEQLPRMTPDREADEPERSPPAELPADLLAGSETLQRLSDLPMIAPLPDALPGESDQTPRTDNQLGELAVNPLGQPPVSEASVPLAPVPMASIPPAVLDAPYREASLRRTADGNPLPQSYRGRRAQDREQILLRNGGSRETEAAVQAALAWLAADQLPDGSWAIVSHGGGQEPRVLGHDRGGAGIGAENAVAALAVLAFLGNGHTQLDGPHRQTVQRGLAFLLCSQAPDGNLAGQARLFARMYCHGMASLAVSEAYAMTGDPRLKPYVEQAIAYTIRAQHPGDGGWRYQPGDPGDMSQFGWQLMALKSAELGGVPVPPATQEGMRRFLQSATSGPYGGLASYRPHGPPTASMTAEALACRMFLGLQPEQAAAQEAVQTLMRESPQDGPMNLYYWYYATLGLFQLQGPAWEIWNDQLQTRLLSAQETAGSAAGSWSPQTVWGGYGGRVYSTAMATLCLEVYYRYLPLLK